MQYVPELIDRSKGAYLESEWWNNQSRDIHADLLYLLDRDLEMYAKAKIMSEITEAANIGFARAANDPLSEPKISYRDVFYFPTNNALKACEISDLFGEITLPVSSSESQILTSTGKVRDTVDVLRSSDNFIFSSVPESVSESRILDAVEDGQYPYLVRVRGVEDTVKIKMVIETNFGAITNNVIEFVPAPYIGGTMFEYITLQDVNNAVTGPVDLNGIEIKTLDTPKNQRYRPTRFHISESDRKQITIGYEGISKLQGADLSIAGIYKIRIERRIWEPKAYIGFKIPGELGKSLLAITPKLKWCNTFTGTIKFNVYNNFESFLSVGTDKITTFSETGIGMPIPMDDDLWVMAEISSRINGSPQIVGFDYETAVI